MKLPFIAIQNLFQYLHFYAQPLSVLILQKLQKICFPNLVFGAATLAHE